MHMDLDCMPCLTRQAVDAARFVSPDPLVHEHVMRETMRRMAEMDFRQSPAILAQLIHRNLREITGHDDPYLSIKARFNRAALAMIPALEQEVEQADDPLRMALRLAIAGNVIDLGVCGDLREDDVQRAINNMLHEPFVGEVDDFRREVERAGRILYLADNAGEIVFDRLLVERLPAGRVVVAVRGAPVLNDATLLDAQVAGLPAIAKVIGNGSDAPGTILDDCSDDFQREVAAADLIIAKGQGNFETLSDFDANLYFLLKAKCAVVAGHLGVPIGTHVAMHGQGRHAASGVSLAMSQDLP